MISLLFNGDAVAGNVFKAGFRTGLVLMTCIKNLDLANNFQTIFFQRKIFLLLNLSADLMVLGNIVDEGRTPSDVVALALETDVRTVLSTGASEGKLTMPLRLVSSGNDDTVIHRVMLLVPLSN